MDARLFTAENLERFSEQVANYTQLDRMIYEDCNAYGSWTALPAMNTPIKPRHHRIEWWVATTGIDMATADTIIGLIETIGLGSRSVSKEDSSGVSLIDYIANATTQALRDLTIWAKAIIEEDTPETDALCNRATTGGIYAIEGLIDENGFALFDDEGDLDQEDIDHRADFGSTAPIKYVASIDEGDGPPKLTIKEVDMLIETMRICVDLNALRKIGSGLVKDQLLCWEDSNRVWTYYKNRKIALASWAKSHEEVTMEAQISRIRNARNLKALSYEGARMYNLLNGKEFNGVTDLALANLKKSAKATLWAEYKAAKSKPQQAEEIIWEN